MTDAQKKMIYILLTALSGPALAIVARLTHMTSDDVQLWLNLVAALTSAAGMAWGITSTTAAGVVQSAATLPPMQAAQALSQVSDSAKILVAQSVPSVATIVVKDTATDGPARLAADEMQPNIVTESQNAIDKKNGS